MLLITLNHAIAADHPESCHFVCTDYMNPLRLPHFCELPKSCFTKRRPKYEVFHLVHWSRSKRAYATQQNTCKVFICTLDQDSLTVELTEELCTITFDSIILSNFTLTKKGKLRSLHSNKFTKSYKHVIYETQL